MKKQDASSMISAFVHEPKRESYDYDIYFTNKETAYKVAVYYLDLLKKLDKSYVMTHVVPL